jgi:hypothetical protein
VCVCLGLYTILVFPRFFKSCEVCSGWVTYCHQCLTCFKGSCVYAPRYVALWLVIDPCVNFVDVCIVIFCLYF